MEAWKEQTYLEMAYTAELYHHGIKGQKWGVRRYQNEDGTLTPLGRKRVDKAITSGNAKKVMKNQKYMSDEEFDRAYKMASLKSMSEGKKKDTALSYAGKKAVDMAMKAAVIAGSAYFLTQTQAGKNLVNKGKTALVNGTKNLMKEAASSVANTAKTAASNTVSAVKKTANNALNESRKTYGQALKNGNKFAKGLDAYGKTVDKILGKGK